MKKASKARGGDRKKKKGCGRAEKSAAKGGVEKGKTNPREHGTKKFQWKGGRVMTTRRRISVKWVPTPSKESRNIEDTKGEEGGKHRIHWWGGSHSKKRPEQVHGEGGETGERRGVYNPKIKGCKEELAERQKRTRGVKPPK